MTRRHCFALDLKEDPALIAAYETAHAPGGVWPEVLAGIREQGVVDMQIWRVFDRLLMICEVEEGFPRASSTPDVMTAWETEMSRYQKELPQAGTGGKWSPMTRIFDLQDHGVTP